MLTYESNATSHVQRQLGPLPGVKRNDVEDELFGRSREAVESFLKKEERLIDPAKAPLSQQVRNFVYNRDDRRRFVAAASNYLKGKQPRLDRDYDVILVGGGIHAGVFLYTLRKNHPGLSVLIVEKSPTICSTFARLGDALVLNSPTFSKVGLNSNIVQGHFVQVSDFDEVVERPFPTAKHLYELATMVLFHADADIAFNFEVEDVRRDNHGYSVSSEDRTVRAKSVVVANGMGEVNLASFARDRVSERIINGDDFIVGSYADRSFSERIRNKRIAVIGAGDTANCVMEGLLPLIYPHRDYGFRTDGPFLPRSIHWIGQDAKDVQQYYFANKLRYCHSGGVIEFFWDGETPFELPTEVWKETKARIECVPEKLISVSHTANALELTTSKHRIESDLVVDCTGRSNQLGALLLQEEYEFIEGQIILYGGQWDERRDHFVDSPRCLDAKRLACKLKRERIFFLGSAGPLRELIDDDEAKDGSLRHQMSRSSLTNSKWSLEHTLPRSVAFAENYLEILNGCMPHNGSSIGF